MEKPPALVVSSLLAFVLFSPVACFSESTKSSDCCGCMGDHGGYECVDGKCVDGSKPHPSSYSPSEAYSYDPPEPGRPAEGGRPERRPGTEPEPPSTRDDAAASDASAAPASDPGDCRSSLDCPAGQWCRDGVCE